MMSKWDELKLAAERLKAGVQDAESFDEHQTLMTLYSMSFREQASPDAVLELISEKERLEDRAQYWKQRAKSAEGHLYASDFEAAMKALHKRTLLAATEWDQLDAVQRAKLEAAVSVVLGAINTQRDSRKPTEEGHE
ncbi:hypothetical protein [Pseudomonas luteola]|uniref:hypothetical protein n=1 Tax=Pseudomonas luteola TaxID=47886 RepID=UPI002897D6AC|nr:hypothetical protein [Pseudomonas luteola]